MGGRLLFPGSAFEDRHDISAKAPSFAPARVEARCRGARRRRCPVRRAGGFRSERAGAGRGHRHADRPHVPRPRPPRHARSTCRRCGCCRSTRGRWSSARWPSRPATRSCAARSAPPDSAAPRCRTTAASASSKPSARWSSASRSAIGSSSRARRSAASAISACRAVRTTASSRSSRTRQGVEPFPPFAQIRDGTPVYAQAGIGGMSELMTAFEEYLRAGLHRPAGRAAHAARRSAGVGLCRRSRRHAFRAWIATSSSSAPGRSGSARCRPVA